MNYASMNRGRIILAFLIAPLTTPLVFMLATLLDGTFNYSVFLPVGLFAYLATAIFGIPAYLLFRVLQWTNIFLFVLGGAVIGFIFSHFIFESYRFYERFLCVLAAGFSALVFRLILSDLNSVKVGASQQAEHN